MMSAVKMDPGRGLVYGLVCVNLEGEPRLSFVDPGLAEQLSLPPVGAPAQELVLPGDLPAVEAALRAQLAAGDEVRLSFRLASPPGAAPATVSCSGRRAGGLLWAALALAPRDFYQGYEQLTQWYKGFQALLETSGQQAYEWDLRARTLSEAGFQSLLWRELMGAEPLLAVDEDGIPSSENVYLADVPAFRRLHRSVLAGGAGGSVELRMRTSYGTYRWCRLTLATLYDLEGKPRRAVGLLADIDEEKREALALAQRNERDQLTGLLNGGTIRARLLTALEKLESGYIALYVVDIDHYQQVTDRLGILFGEAVLIGAADKLSAAAGEGAVCGRIGATTLAVYRRAASRREAVALGRGFCEKLRQSLADGKQELCITASVGMVLIPPGEKDFSLLLRQADLALAAAKRAGGGRLVAYRRSIRDDGADAGLYFGEAPAAAGSAKSFNENMFYLFFNMLYEGEDPDRAVDLVLRTAGQHFHVSRAYIYEAEPEDRQVLRLTHEWCDEETESLGGRLETFSIAGESAAERAARAGVYQCDDTGAPGALPRGILPRVQESGIRAFLQCGILDRGLYRGCIGFDDCVAPRIWTDEEAETLARVARIVGGYLLRIRAQERRARQDPRTGLPSFPRFRRQAARTLADRRDEGWAVVSIDIVRFGDVGDTFGAETSERLLARLGAQLRGQLSGGELACRVRRDEFALLVRQREGETLLERARAFERDFTPAARALLGSYDLRFRCGFSPVARGGGASFSGLYDCAVLARRRARRGGRGGCVYYSAELGAEEQRRRAIERQAARALAEREFQLALVPVVSLESGRPAGARVLARWSSPALGELRQEEFLPQFEDSGFVLALDYYLIDEACALLRRWQRAGAALPVTVVFSRLHLAQYDFVARVTASAEKAGVPRRLLRLELADSTGLRDNAGALDTLRALRDAGFPVTVGDFALNDSVIDLRGGTPCDQVVLPRQLFASAREEPLLEGLMQVVEALGLSALARGVETEAEAERLRRAGCPLAEGGAFSVPLSPEEAGELFRRGRG